MVSERYVPAAMDPPAQVLLASPAAAAVAVPRDRSDRVATSAKSGRNIFMRYPRRASHPRMAVIGRHSTPTQKRSLECLERVKAQPGQESGSSLRAEPLILAEVRNLP